MEFLQTNLNDIIAYALIVINALLYILNRHSTKVSGTNLRESLRHFTQSKIKEQNDSVDGMMKEFTKGSFKQLADNLTEQREYIERLEKQIKDNAQEMTGLIEAQKRTIQELTKKLDSNAQLTTKLNQDVSTMKEGA